MLNTISELKQNSFPTTSLPNRQSASYHFKQCAMDSFNGKTIADVKPGVKQALEIFFGRHQKGTNRKQEIIEEPLKPGPYGEVKPQYRNFLPENMRPFSKPNLHLREEIQTLRRVGDLDDAEQRIKAFSNYMLKMVGFVTPSGYHWFSEAMENLIFGAQGTKLPPDKLEEPAKELWQLLAMADDYWTSNTFIQYLSDIEPSPARNATLKAIRELKRERMGRELQLVAFGRSKSTSKPIETDLKFIDELMTCAYSGVKMNSDGKDPVYRVSAEHIFPQSLGGKDNDFNFIMASGDSNNMRRNMKLLDYLKGRSIIS
jgi:hypothetical protein